MYLQVEFYDRKSVLMSSHLLLYLLSQHDNSIAKRARPTLLINLNNARRVFNGLNNSCSTMLRASPSADQTLTAERIRSDPCLLIRTRTWTLLDGADRARLRLSGSVQQHIESRHLILMWSFILHNPVQSNAFPAMCYARLARCIQTHQRHRNGIVPSTSVPNNNERSKEIRVILSTVVNETAVHMRAGGKEGRSDEVLRFCVCDGVVLCGVALIARTGVEKAAEVMELRRGID